MRTFLTVFFGGLTGVLLMVGVRSADWYATWDSAIFPLLQIEANSAHFTPDFSMLLGVIICFGLAWVYADVPRASQRNLVGFATAILLVTGALVLALHGYLFSPILPLMGGVATVVMTEGLMRVGPGALRRKVEETFGLSLGRRTRLVLTERSAATFEQPRMERVSVLTLQFESPDRYLQVMQPEEWANMNRLYLRYATDFLCESGAYLESVTASGLRAVFGAPLTLEKPAQVATRCALDLVARLERLNLEADNLWQQILDFNIGIATGNCLCGNYGAPRARSYLVAGRAVVFSTQLCQVAPKYGCRTLLCAETFQEADDTIEVRPIDVVRLPDGSEGEIYELLCMKGALTPERKRSKEAFIAGVRHMQARRWDEAVEEFSRARIKGIPDPAIDACLQRMDTLRKSSLEQSASDLRELP